MARKPNPNNPPCPDCGGATVGDGTRAHTDIKRFRCKGDVENTKCATKPRRFSELTKDTVLDDAIKKPVPVREALRDDTHVFLITWAQNNTPVDTGFWSALSACQEHRDADLMVIKGHYRNPTVRSEEADDEWWADEVMAVGLWDKPADLCPALTVLADYRVQPTAVRPLTGLDSVTGGKSGIIGHPKLEMRCIPTPQNALPKQMQTTGACTVQNYSNSKAGKKGEFHHVMGALIVEIRKDVFYMRQINACPDGSFVDVDTEYLPDGTHRPAPRALALSMGDWHSGFTSPSVIEATFGGGDSIVGATKPEQIIFDDVLDQYGRNHHHRGDPFIAHAKAHDRYDNRDNLRYEVEAACHEVVSYTKEAVELCDGPVKGVVKASNHDEALTRYIIERNWKNDPVNAEFYLETSLKMLRGTKMAHSGAQYPSAFGVWAAELMPDVLVLGRRDSHMVADIECSFHGDIGPNGARGSLMGFSKIGVKTIIGHSHVPGIVDGCYQSGTSTYLDLEYARGPSSWMNSHVIVYYNGKRAIITVDPRYGKWRFK